MDITKTILEGVVIVEPRVFWDKRGYFLETYTKRDFEKIGLGYDFIQDNISFSANRGTLRGLHFQNDDMAQTKLVRCISGAILDVAVDLRKDSPTYKKWVAVELSSNNKQQLLIPRGFAHGYITLADDTVVIYKVDNYYSPAHDRTIRYNDPEFNINWGEKDPILSDKDKNAPLFKDSDCTFR